MALFKNAQMQGAKKARTRGHRLKNQCLQLRDLIAQLSCLFKFELSSIFLHEACFFADRLLKSFNIMLIKQWLKLHSAPQSQEDQSH